jgi:hypothetical protein
LFGDIGHDIAAAVGKVWVDQLGDDFDDQRLQACGGAWREGLGH